MWSLILRWGKRTGIGWNFPLDFYFKSWCCFWYVRRQSLVICIDCCNCSRCHVVLRKEIDALGLWARIGAALFAGGAIGNLIDRARQGLVIDFLIFVSGPYLMWLILLFVQE